jgi:hypothetical protein
LLQPHLRNQLRRHAARRRRIAALRRRSAQCSDAAQALERLQHGRLLLLGASSTARRWLQGLKASIFDENRIWFRSIFFAVLILKFEID